MLIQTTNRHKRVNINPRKVELVHFLLWGDLIVLADGRQYQVSSEQSALLVSRGRTNSWGDIQRNHANCPDAVLGAEW